VLCAIGFGVLGGTYLRETVDLFWHSFAGAGSSVKRVSFGLLIRIRWTEGSLSSLTLAAPSHPPHPLAAAAPSLSSSLSHSCSRPPPSLPPFPIAATTSPPLDLHRVGASLQLENWWEEEERGEGRTQGDLVFILYLCCN
jgi:hypothetical protein